ncbi:MAG: ATP-dependent Clp protease ATP-binding subunit ClpX, partial [Gammaproteobacteria bacterium]|nr:ATP-dependent Clp protease ATP-binding subunit ClpX [Gammaproteobacteria bacterium]
EEIVEQRIGQRRIGFGKSSPEGTGDYRNRDDLVRLVEPEDLQRYGLIPELVGRLPVSVGLSELDEADLVRILEEPRNALVKQYRKMFELEDVGITFDRQALREVAKKAADRGTGARGLRAVLEEVMQDVMFEVPSRHDVREIVITVESVTSGTPPLLVLEGERQKKEA